jgi:hypothetical protein
VKTTTSSYLKRALLLVGLVALFVAPAAQAAGRWATLEAIHHLENPRNSPRPGPFGELGPYQFRPETWKMHTKVPFRRALDRAESDAVAVVHYEYLKRGLERNGMPATPYTIALAWNGGLDAAVKGNSPRVAHDYARRAVNLAEEIETNSAANEARAPAVVASSTATVAKEESIPMVVAQPRSVEPMPVVGPTLTTSEEVIRYAAPRLAQAPIGRAQKEPEIEVAAPLPQRFSF